MRIVSIFCLLLLCSCHSTEQEQTARFLPAPTTGTLINDGEEEEGRGDQRRLWEESLHRAAPDVNWRAVEYANSKNQYRQRQLLSQQGLRRGTPVSLANGQVEGEWIERGAINQAGSLHDLAYDSAADAIYALADGGSIWRIDLQTEEWTLINQDLQFSNRLLQMIELPDNSGQRMIAAVAQQPHFSDDGGSNWNAAELVDFEIIPGSGRIIKSFIANGGKIYLAAKEDYWASTQLFISEDQGQSFRRLTTLSAAQTFVDISQPHHSDLLLLQTAIGNSLYTYQINLGPDLFTILGSSIVPGGHADRLRLSTTMLTDNSLQLLTYNRDSTYLSTDGGENWTASGELPVNPWEVGVQFSKSDPNQLMLGAVELYYSFDQGGSWEMASGWSEYYDNPDYKLHADMMHFAEFMRPDGSYQTFISNHGGLSVATDDISEHFNLSLAGLNNAQYYSTITKPFTEDEIYAGAQDQGLQWSTSQTSGSETFDQIISGDYGNLAYSHVFPGMYAMYPGGGISKWNTETDAFLAWYDVDSENEFVWISPFMVVPDESATTGECLYLAGGSAYGGEGSFVIKLSDLDGSPNSADFLAEDLPFDFLTTNGGGQLSALAYSPVNYDRFYAATTDGRFYHSDNAGEDWEPTINFVPSGNYLYGQAILPSKLDSNMVWFGGSGYSNPAVYQSTNGGAQFESISEGLPPTVVLRLASNADESLLFAATETGPFVYVVADERWFDLSGLDAPAGRYYSVEYLPESDVARFSSYNRGVWDFNLSTGVSANHHVASQLADWTVFPNPTTGPIRTRDLPAASSSIQITDSNGRQIKTVVANDLDLSQQPTGVYWLTPLDEAGRVTGKVQRLVKW